MIFKKTLSAVVFAVLIVAPFAPLSAYAFAPADPSVSGPTTGEVNVSYTFTAQSTDPEGDMVNYGFDWDNDGVVDSYSGFVSSGTSAQSSHTWTTAGTYTLNVTTKDSGAPTSISDPVSHTIVISDAAPVEPPVNVAPNTPVIGGPSTGTTSVPYSFTVTATDPESDNVTYGFDWDNDGVVDEWTSYFASGISTSLSHTWATTGSQTFTVVAKDNGSPTAISSAASASIVVSSPAPVNVAPSDPIITGVATGTVSSTYTFTVQSTDPEGDMINYGFDWDNNGVVDEWTGFMASGASAQLATSWASIGTYTFSVTAKDNGSPTGLSSVVTKTVVISAGPIVVTNTAPNTPVIGGPSTGTTSVSYSFTATATDPQDNNVTYGFDWENDGVVDEWTSYFASGISTSVSHTWATASTYTVAVTAKDIEGSISDPSTLAIVISDPIIIVSNTAPNTPVISGPSTGTTSVSYSFTATATDPENDQIDYGFDWDNDGVVDEYTGFVSSGASSTLSHTWATAGTYTVSVTAKDASNAISSPATLTIVISDPIVVIPNNAPVVTSITGPATGSANVSYAFTATATDADNDNVEYGFDWNNSGAIELVAGEDWTPAVASGTPVTRSWIWTTGGVKDFQVLARDTQGDTGSRAGSITISGVSSIGFTIATSSSGFFTSESGATAPFTVILDSAPLADVTLSIMSSDFTEATTSVTSLTFTPSNWNVSQTVTVTGVDDLALDGDISYTVAVGPSTSADINYNNLSAQTVSIMNYDNEISPVVGGSISSFGLNPSSITSGATSTLSWAASNATLCVASGAWTGNQPLSGSLIVGPYTATSTYTATFTLDCGNVNGTTTQSAILTIDPAGATSSTPTGTGGSTGGTSGGHGGAGYSGPCIGFACSSSNGGATGAASSDVTILLDSPVVNSISTIPHPPKTCASTDFITTYMKRGIENNPNEVKKVQYFLNTYERTSLPVDGIFDEVTENAVKAFQVKHADEILAPWGTNEPTGIVYVTTAAAMNRIFCSDNPTYTGDNDIKDIINPVLYTPVDNSNEFQNVIGSAGTTTATSTNTASVFGAISGDILNLIKGIPFYELGILLLTILGAGFIVQGALKKDVLSPKNSLSSVWSIAALAIGSVLNVLNTLSFMIWPDWFAAHIGMNPSWVIGLDIVNLVSLVGVSLSILFKKTPLSGTK